MTTPSGPGGVDMPARLARLKGWAPLRTLSDLVCAVVDIWRLTDETNRRTIRMESRMSQLSDALADLDAQIDDLEAYVLSDDATDAAEVQSRTARIKAALAAVQTPAEPTA